VGSFIVFAVWFIGFKFIIKYLFW